MFSITKIEGKDLGCIAQKKIKKGTLILRENPALVLADDTCEDIAFIQTLIDAYLKMDNTEKEEYLNLANKYTQYKGTGSESDKIFIKAFTDRFENSVTIRLAKMKLTNIDMETAQRVYQIFETNSFHNGVCLKMSRFNHSCTSNAEFFWNTDEKIRDLRSIRNILEGEEITVNYKGLDIQDMNARIKVLLDFHFFCECVACDLSEEDARKEM